MVKRGVRQIVIKKNTVKMRLRKKQNEQANSVDPDEMAHMSHLR